MEYEKVWNEKHYQEYKKEGKPVKLWGHKESILDNGKSLIGRRCEKTYDGRKEYKINVHNKCRI